VGGTGPSTHRVGGGYFNVIGALGRALYCDWSRGPGLDVRVSVVVVVCCNWSHKNWSGPGREIREVVLGGAFL
jgi:hypothetical protein